VDKKTLVTPSSEYCTNKNSS